MMDKPKFPPLVSPAEFERRKSEEDRKVNEAKRAKVMRVRTLSLAEIVFSNGGDNGARR